MFGSEFFTYSTYGSYLLNTIVAASSFLIFKAVLFIRERQKRYRLLEECGIKGPKPSLWSGNMKQTITNDLSLYDAEQLRETYGDIVGFYLGDDPVVCTTNLDLLKKIFVDANPNFVEKTVDILETHLTHSIFFAKYPRWKIMRKTLAPTFSKFSVRSSKSTDAIEDSIKLMIGYIENKFNATAVDGKLSLDLQDLLKSTTLHLINSLVSELPDIEVKENDENVKSLDSFLAYGQKGVVELALKMPTLKPILQFVYDHFEISKFLGAITNKVDMTVQEEFAKIEKMKKLQLDTNYEDPDEKILNKLTRLHYEKKLTRKEVIGNIEAILIGGYDTTSTQLTYIFWALAKHQKIQEELRADLVNNGWESAYLDRVIKETLRLYPSNVLFSTRVANDNVKLTDKVTIPKGTRVVYHHFLMNRDSRTWEDPLKFDPSRFEGDILKDLHPAAYQPFGFNPRRCLGQNLAELEMKMVITEMILKYRFHLKSPMEICLKIFTIFLTEPHEKIVLELERLDTGNIPQKV